MGVKKMTKVAAEAESAAQTQFDQELQIEEQKMYMRVNHASVLQRQTVMDAEEQRLAAWAVRRSAELGLTTGESIEYDAGVDAPVSSGVPEVPAIPSGDKPGSAAGEQENGDSMQQTGAEQDPAKESVDEPEKSAEQLAVEADIKAKAEQAVAELALKQQALKDAPQDGEKAE